MSLCDVAIIGAGLAGLECARRLGTAGLRVVLLDRKPSLADSVHTTGIFVRRTLEDFELPAACLGPPVRHVTLYSPALRGLELESPHVEFRVGRMAQLYQRLLDDAVRSGVTWLPATRCVGMEPGAPTRIHIQRGGRREGLLTRFVVAADGAQSRAARYLGLDSNAEFIAGVEDVLRGVPLSGPPRFHVFLDPELAPGYIAWMVNDGQEAHLGVGGYARRFDPVAALEKFRSRLDGIADLRPAKRVERRGGLIPVGGVLGRLANHHGLLVGDAAGAVSPLTGRRARSCGAALRSGRPRDRAVSFHRESGGAGGIFRRALPGALCLASVDAARAGHGPQPAAGGAACVLLRLPGPRHLVWHVFFGRGSFPDSPSASPRCLALQSARQTAAARSR